MFSTSNLPFHYETWSRSAVQYSFAYYLPLLDTLLVPRICKPGASVDVTSHGDISCIAVSCNAFLHDARLQASLRNAGLLVRAGQPKA